MTKVYERELYTFFLQEFGKLFSTDSQKSFFIGSIIYVFSFGVQDPCGDHRQQRPQLPQGPRSAPPGALRAVRVEDARVHEDGAQAAPGLRVSGEKITFNP